MRGYLRALGPGLVTGASDDDPSGIATYFAGRIEFRLRFSVDGTFDVSADGGRAGDLRSHGPCDRPRVGRAYIGFRCAGIVRAAWATSTCAGANNPGADEDRRLSWLVRCSARSVRYRAPDTPAARWREAPTPLVRSDRRGAIDPGLHRSTGLSAKQPHSAQEPW